MITDTQISVVVRHLLIIALVSHLLLDKLLVRGGVGVELWAVLHPDVCVRDVGETVKTHECVCQVCVWGKPGDN